MMQKIQRFGGAMFTPVLLFAFAGITIGIGTLFTTEAIMGGLASCGVYSIELFVSGDDVYFSQVTPRPSRDGLVTLATQRVNQFDLQARATQELPIDSTLVSPGAVRFLPGVTPSLEAIAAAMEVEETTVRMFGPDVLILSTADSAAEARVRTDDAARAMKKM